jgi:glycosyltransferase involved in cell wall biosynthesis
MMTDILEHTRCCVLIPTYNNAHALSNVIDDVLKYTRRIIVVNDGSTDATLSILGRYPQIVVVSYTQNQGKGHALRTGFKAALDNGYDHVITIDSDGQHHAYDLHKFADMLPAYPNAIIIGARNMNQEGVPAKSNFGNRFSSFWVKVETGYDLPDTQSGYRLYPVRAMSKIKYFSKKYEFEIEVLAKAVWNGVELRYVPVDVYYAPKEERVSHFRPFKDFFRISVVNTILCILAFGYYWPRNTVRRYKKKSLKEVIREDVLGSSESNLKIALAMAFGVFMGIFPVWGYQLIIGFSLAHLFKLNKTIFFIFANISLPPMIPFILYVSYLTGGVMMGHASWALPMPDSFSFEFVKQNLWQYLLGASVFAILAGVAVLAIAYSILTIFRRKN